ncbi:MAG: hypothetical protein JWO88_3609 [Frankiales bacterium]|nr:hypothetical protein [Frankiales bacterium]
MTAAFTLLSPNAPLNSTDFWSVPIVVVVSAHTKLASKPTVHAPFRRFRGYLVRGARQLLLSPSLGSALRTLSALRVLNAVLRAAGVRVIVLDDATRMPILAIFL